MCFTLLNARSSLKTRTGGETTPGGIVQEAAPGSAAEHIVGGCPVDILGDIPSLGAGEVAETNNRVVGSWSLSFVETRA